MPELYELSDSDLLGIIDPLDAMLENGNLMCRSLKLLLFWQISLKSGLKDLIVEFLATKCDDLDAACSKDDTLAQLLDSSYSWRHWLSWSFWRLMSSRIDSRSGFWGSSLTVFWLRTPLERLCLMSFVANFPQGLTLWSKMKLKRCFWQTFLTNSTLFWVCCNYWI